MTRFLVLLLFLPGCGASPPPAPPKAKLTLGLLAPKASVAQFPRAEKTYIILGNTALPDDEDAFVRAFSLKSVDPEVGRANRGYQVALPGVLCDIATTEKPKDIPRHILIGELKPHGLSEDEAKGLEASSHFVKVQCVPDPQLPLRALPEHAEVTAETIANMTDGWIHDVHTGRYWPRKAWQALRAEKRRYDSRRLFRIFTLRGDDGRLLIGTRGLASFGKPDLFLFPVTEEYAERILEPFVAFIDTTLDEANMGPGYTVQLGELNVRLIPKDTYMATVQGKAPSLPAKGSGQSHADYVLVDPTTEQGNASAYGAFLRRFIVR